MFIQIFLDNSMEMKKTGLRGVTCAQIQLCVQVDPQLVAKFGEQSSLPEVKYHNLALQFDDIFI